MPNNRLFPASLLIATVLLFMPQFFSSSVARAQSAPNRLDQHRTVVTMATQLGGSAVERVKRYEAFFGHLQKLNGRFVFLKLSIPGNTRSLTGALPSRVSIDMMGDLIGRKRGKDIKSTRCTGSNPGILNARGAARLTLNHPNHYHSLLYLHLRAKMRYPVQMLLCKTGSGRLEVSGYFFVAVSSIATANSVELFPVKFSDLRQPRK